jgi:hypothetical protein
VVPVCKRCGKSIEAASPTVRMVYGVRGVLPRVAVWSELTFHPTCAVEERAEKGVPATAWTSPPATPPSGLFHHSIPDSRK